MGTEGKALEGADGVSVELGLACQAAPSCFRLEAP